jgi:hypothetical protein
MPCKPRERLTKTCALSTPAVESYLHLSEYTNCLQRRSLSTVLTTGTGYRDRPNVRSSLKTMSPRPLLGGVLRASDLIIMILRERLQWYCGLGWLLDSVGWIVQTEGKYWSFQAGISFKQHLPLLAGSRTPILSDLAPSPAMAITLQIVRR